MHSTSSVSVASTASTMDTSIESKFSAAFGSHASRGGAASAADLVAVHSGQSSPNSSFSSVKSSSDGTSPSPMATVTASYNGVATNTITNTPTGPLSLAHTQLGLKKSLSSTIVPPLVYRGEFPSPSSRQSSSSSSSSPTSSSASPTSSSLVVNKCDDAGLPLQPLSPSAASLCTPLASPSDGTAQVDATTSPSLSSRGNKTSSSSTAATTATNKAATATQSDNEKTMIFRKEMDANSASLPLMYKNESHVDLVLCCHGKIFKCHRMVMADASNYVSQSLNSFHNNNVVDQVNQSSGGDSPPLTASLTPTSSTSSLSSTTTTTNGQTTTSIKKETEDATSSGSTAPKSQSNWNTVMLLPDDIKVADMEAILNFIYNGQVEVKQDCVESFLHAAHRLKIKGLINVNVRYTGKARNSLSSSSLTTMVAANAQNSLPEAVERRRRVETSSDGRKSNGLPIRGNNQESPSAAAAIAASVAAAADAGLLANGGMNSPPPSPPNNSLGQQHNLLTASMVNSSLASLKAMSDYNDSNATPTAPGHHHQQQHHRGNMNGQRYPMNGGRKQQRTARNHQQHLHPSFHSAHHAKSVNDLFNGSGGPYSQSLLNTNHSANFLPFNNNQPIPTPPNSSSNKRKGKTSNSQLRFHQQQQQHLQQEQAALQAAQITQQLLSAQQGQQGLSPEMALQLYQQFLMAAAAVSGQGQAGVGGNGNSAAFNSAAAASSAIGSDATSDLADMDREDGLGMDDEDEDDDNRNVVSRERNGEDEEDEDDEDDDSRALSIDEGLYDSISFSGEYGHDQQLPHGLGTQNRGASLTKSLLARRDKHHPQQHHNSLNKSGSEHSSSSLASALSMQTLAHAAALRHQQQQQQQQQQHHHHQQQHLAQQLAAAAAAASTNPLAALSFHHQQTQQQQQFANNSSGGPCMIEVDADPTSIMSFCQDSMTIGGVNGGSGGGGGGALQDSHSNGPHSPLQARSIMPSVKKRRVPKASDLSVKKIKADIGINLSAPKDHGVHSPSSTSPLNLLTTKAESKGQQPVDPYAAAAVAAAAYHAKMQATGTACPINNNSPSSNASGQGGAGATWTGGNKWRCDTCNKYYGNKQTLKEHMDYFHSDREEQIFICNICSKEYTWRKSLMKHYRDIHQMRNTPELVEINRRLAELSTPKNRASSQTSQNLSSAPTVASVLSAKKQHMNDFQKFVSVSTGAHRGGVGSAGSTPSGPRSRGHAKSLNATPGSNQPQQAGSAASSFLYNSEDDSQHEALAVMMMVRRQQENEQRQRLLEAAAAVAVQQAHGKIRSNGSGEDHEDEHENDDDFGPARLGNDNDRNQEDVQGKSQSGGSSSNSSSSGKENRQDDDEEDHDDDDDEEDSNNGRGYDATSQRGVPFCVSQEDEEDEHQNSFSSPPTSPSSK